MSSLSLDHLKTFSDVVALGSFSAAAARQNVSQPAVSFQIKQLEKRLGVRLLERIGRKTLPTAAGTELLGHFWRINGEVDAALAAMERHAGGSMGRVRIGTGATACIYVLPALLGGLRKRHPGLEISVTTGNTAEIAKAVEDNILDIALVTLPVSSRSLSVEVVMEDEFVLVTPADFDLPDALTPDILARLPLIMFEPAGNTRRIADEWLARNDIGMAPVMSLGSVEAIKELIEAGLGCSILPAMAFRKEKQDGRFRTRPLVPRLSRQLAVIMRKDKILHRGLREVALALGRKS